MHFRYLMIIAFSLCIAAQSSVARAADDDMSELLERLRNTDAEERRRALWDVRERDAQDPDVMAEITKLLGDADVEVRAEAIADFVAFGGDPEVGRKFLSDPAPAVRSSTLSALQQRFPDVKLAERFLSDPDANVRETALRTFLQHRGDPSRIEPLLADPDGMVRLSALHALQHLKPDLALAQSMMADRDRDVRNAAVGSFLELKGDREAVVSLLSDPESNVRLTVARTFVKEGLHLDRAAETLLRLVNDLDRNQFVEAMNVFEGLGGERAVQIASQLVEMTWASDDRELISTIPDQLEKFDGLREQHAETLLKALSRNLLEARRASVAILRNLARDCRFSIDPMVKALNDEDPSVRAYSTITLLQLGENQPTVIDCLRSCLDKTAKDELRIAADGLRSFPEAASKVVPELIELLGVEDRFVRWYAEAALSHVNVDRIVPLLMDEIEAPDALQARAYYWESIARVCGEYGTAARKSIPDLIGLSRHADPDVVFAATEALGSVGVRDNAAIQRLEELLNSSDKEQRTRVAAIKGLLATAGTDDQLRAALRDTLRQRLNDSDPAVKAKATEFLIGLGEDPANVIPALETVFASDDIQAVFAAGDTLRSLGPRMATLVPAIAKMLESDTFLATLPGWSGTTANQLAPGLLAAIGRDAVPALIKAMDHPEAKVRAHAAEALGAIGVDAAPAVSALIAHIDDEEDVQLSYGHVGGLTTVQTEVMKAFAGIGSAAAPAVPRLQAILVDAQEDPSYGFVLGGDAATALGGIGPAAADALPTLWTLAGSDEDERLKIDVVCAIGQITPDDPRILTTLEQHLRWLGEYQHGDGILLPSDSGQLLEACERLGGRAAPLVPVLIGLVDAPLLERELHLRAAQAVVRIDHDNVAAWRFLKRRATFEDREEYYVAWLTAREALAELAAEQLAAPE